MQRSSDGSQEGMDSGSDYINYIILLKFKIGDMLLGTFIL